jgi:Domain of unknown function (DUF2431)
VLVVVTLGRLGMVNNRIVRGSRDNVTFSNPTSTPRPGTVPGYCTSARTLQTHVKHNRMPALAKRKKKGEMEDQVESNEESRRTVLTLGDGDFTFSLDLARWLHTKRTLRVHLIATGIDTLSELTAKYKDSPSILKRLLRCGSPRQDDCGGVTPVKVTVLHGVNAVDEIANQEVKGQPTCSPTEHQIRADEVIFNHPHLGVENAQLHRLFLCHLFHAVERRWLNQPSGVFHLTLAHGQFERWGCDAAARRHGLVLVAETPFVAPAVEVPSYELRRHQSGKSFKSRRSRGESTTYTFSRATRPTDGDNSANVQGVRPFWISVDSSDAKCQQPFDSSDTKCQQPFNCSLCYKSFREVRSLRNHMLSKHPDHGQSRNKRKREMNEADPDPAAQTLECRYYFEFGVARSFSTLQALKDHVLAKHTALHTTIPADWSTRKARSDESSQESVYHSPLDSMEPQSFGSCDVCGFQYESRGCAVKHQKMFLPAIQVTTIEARDATTYSCSFCSKSFRERRAQLQHENRCKARRGGSAVALVSR